MSILNKYYCLQLNKNWMPIGVKMVKEGVKMMCAMRDDKDAKGKFISPADALDIEYAMVEGRYDTTRPLNYTPVPWEEWIRLPVRDCDFGIKTTFGAVRVPTVLIAKNYAGNPDRAPRPTKSAILARDNHTCQYTGRKLLKSQLNVDHVIPRGKGGQNTWENLVTSDKALNSKKGNRLNEEVGLKLIRKPGRPPAIKVGFTIKNIHDIPDWEPFLIHK